MNRRNFLSALGVGAAGLALDPERLLWVPGKKTIFVPKPQFRPIGQLFVELKFRAEEFSAKLQDAQRVARDFNQAWLHSEIRKHIYFERRL